MADDEVTRNLNSMDNLDFRAWNGADWHGLFARYHTDDVLVDVHGQPPTHGIEEHIDAMKAMVQATGGIPAQIKSHPIKFGSGDWTCVVGEFENGSRMVTVAEPRSTARIRMVVSGESAGRAWSCSFRGVLILPLTGSAACPGL
jgi:ketosteroid isomerase-like protein